MNLNELHSVAISSRHQADFIKRLAVFLSINKKGKTAAQVTNEIVNKIKGELTI